MVTRHVIYPFYIHDLCKQRKYLKLISHCSTKKQIKEMVFCKVGILV
jgi:hypothetical protein